MGAVRLRWKLPHVPRRDWDVTCYVGVIVSRGKDRNTIRGELGFSTKWEVVAAVLLGKDTVCVRKVHWCNYQKRSPSSITYLASL
jgi:hypothetical protein